MSSCGRTRGATPQSYRGKHTPSCCRKTVKITFHRDRKIQNQPGLASGFRLSARNKRGGGRQQRGKTERETGNDELNSSRVRAPLLPRALAARRTPAVQLPLQLFSITVPFHNSSLCENDVHARPTASQAGRPATPPAALVARKGSSARAEKPLPLPLPLVQAPLPPPPPFAAANTNTP